MGRIITRIRPGDKELWDRLVEEAQRLYATGASNAQAVEHLIDIAGDNLRAFDGIGGKRTQGLSRTPEGQGVLRLLGTAAAERNLRTRVGVPKVIGRRRTTEERVLAAMPVAEGFDLLAREEPRLLLIADEALRVAQTGRSAGEDEASVRASICEIAVRMVNTDPIIGPRAPKGDDGLIVTTTAVQVAWAYLASITGVSVLDFQ